MPSQLAVPPLSLPPVQPYQLFTDLENGWSDQYGAVRHAAAYAGIDQPDRYLNAVWHHGCLGPWMEFSAEIQCYRAPRAQELPILVARETQAAFLRSQGYSKAKAIGLPIAYVPVPGTTRIPKSLLVVPTHTLSGATFSDPSLFGRYVADIVAVRGHFDRVTVCVHPTCQKNGFWVNEFTAQGFEIIFGAQNNDANALLRMRSLFSQFETVTTNGWGSHIAYALANGARVSLHGTPVVEVTNYLKDTMWSANRPSLEQALAGETAAADTGILKPFVVPPQAAQGDIELGRWLIGADHRLSPPQMRDLLNETCTFIPRHANGGNDGGSGYYRQATHAWKARVSAALANKQPAVAAQGLFAAVQSVQAAQNPRILLEALLEIGPRLAVHNAEAGRQLMTIAAQLAEQLERPLARQRALGFLTGGVHSLATQPV